MCYLSFFLINDLFCSYINNSFGIGFIYINFIQSLQLYKFYFYSCIDKCHELSLFTTSAYDQFFQLFFNTRDCWFFNHFNLVTFFNTLLDWMIDSQQSYRMSINHGHITKYTESLSLKWFNKIGYHEMSRTILYGYFFSYSFFHKKIANIHMSLISCAWISTILLHPNSFLVVLVKLVNIEIISLFLHKTYQTDILWQIIT